MAYLLDGAIILVFLLAVWIGYKRGFIKTMAGLVAFLAAALIALLFSGPIAEGVYGATVEPGVISAIDAQLELGTGTLEEGVDKALAGMPAFVTNALANTGILSGADVTAKLTGADSTLSVSQQIAQQVVAPVVVPLLKVIIMLLVFILVYIIASIVLRVLNVVAKLPLLKQLNQGLGLVAGAVSGALWALFIVSVLQVLAAAGTADAVINQALINDTHVVNWLIGINPAGSVLQDVMNLVTTE
ncbi:MAG: CvpA family protein [Clostridia bacterium]|nr:CvpA family protein [Clostridia bacterium]